MAARTCSRRCASRVQPSRPSQSKWDTEITRHPNFARSRRLNAVRPSKMGPSGPFFGAGGAEKGGVPAVRGHYPHRFIFEGAGQGRARAHLPLRIMDCGASIARGDLRSR